MDSIIDLPIELVVTIVSLLDIKDRVKCRRVCKLFKDAIDINLQFVTHVHFGKSDLSRDRNFQIFRQFLDARFESINITGFVYVFFSNIASFLASKCPNLQVLYLEDVCSYGISLEKLHVLSKSLRFFRFQGVKIQNTEQAIRLLSDFKQLQNFSLEYGIDELNEFRENLQWKNNSLTHLLNPSYDSLLQISNSIETVNIRSIEYNEKWKGTFTIPASIITNLQCLTMTNSVDSFGMDFQQEQVFAVPLSNLISLNANFHASIQYDYENLFASKKLETIWCDWFSPLPFELLQNFFISLNSYKELTFLNCSAYDTDNDLLEGSILKVSLPPKISLLLLPSHGNFIEIIEPSSQTLTEFKIYNLLNYEFNFPQMIDFELEFTLQNYKLNEEDTEKLARSLSKCTEMEYITILFRTVQETSVLQTIIDSLYTMKKLKKVDFKMLSNVNSSAPRNESVLTIDQSKLSSVENFKFTFPVNVRFHTLESCIRKENFYSETRLFVGGAVYRFKNVKLEG